MTLHPLLILIGNSVEPSKALIAWADVIGKLSPVLIGLAGFWIARSQWIIARSRLRADLMEPRAAAREKLRRLLFESHLKGGAGLLAGLEDLKVEIKRVFGKKAARACNKLIFWLKELDDPFWTGRFYRKVSKEEVERRIRNLEKSLEREMRLA